MRDLRFWQPRGWLMVGVVILWWMAQGNGGGPAVPSNVWAFLGALLGGGGLAAILGAIAKATGYFEVRRQTSIAERDRLIDVLQAKADKLNRDLSQERETFAANLKAERDDFDKEIKELRHENMKLSVALVRKDGELRLAYAQLAERDPGSVDTIVDLVVAVNQDGVIIDVSPSVAFLLHYMKHELIGKSVTVLIPPRERQRHLDGFARVVRENRAPDPGKVVCTYALTKDGEEVPIDLQLSAWVDKSTKRYMYAAVIRRRFTSDGDPPDPDQTVSIATAPPGSAPPPILPANPPGS